MTRLVVIALILLGITLNAQAQQPTCEDRLLVADTLSAQKDQLLASLVAQLKAARQQLDDLKKAQQEGEKK